MKDACKKTKGRAQRPTHQENGLPDQGVALKEEASQQSHTLEGSGAVHRSEKRRGRVTQLRFHFQEETPNVAGTGGHEYRESLGCAFPAPTPFSSKPRGAKEGGEGRTHTHPSMPACAPPSSSTCLLLPGSWKNVKLSSVIKVGFSKGFKNISESKTLFFLQKMSPSIIPLTDASWDLLSQLVFLSGFPRQLRACLHGGLYLTRMQASLCKGPALPQNVHSSVT